MTFIASAAFALVLLADAGPAIQPGAASASSTRSCAPASIGGDSYCRLNSVRIHYVDHGGCGPVIILLAGLGSSARIFDDFAPLLRQGHRVIAVTRRGYGQSSDAIDGDYSNDALVGDIIQLMDRLGIDRASFVGHSLAGGELAGLGLRQPDRVDRLVYLDAAYDRSAAPVLMAQMPPMPPPNVQALASHDNFSRWRRQSLGVDSAAVAADVAQIMRVTPGGVVPRTSSAVAEAILAGDIAAPPRWQDIMAPSLAIYSSKDVAEQVPPEATPAQRAAFIDYSVRRLRPWMLRQQADFLARRRCGAAIEAPNSGHHLFLERPEWLARRILSFLTTTTPCASTLDGGKAEASLSARRRR